MDIIFTTNSPGEVMGWVRPVAFVTQDIFPKAQVTVFVTPCAFASGTEKGVVEALLGVHQAFSPKEYLSFILLRKRPRGFSPGKKGFVLFLGGDLNHAIFLGRRLNYPVFAYMEGSIKGKGAIEIIFRPYGEGDEQVKVVGNPMLDAVEMGLGEGSPLSLEGETIALFPGSRPHEVSFMIPFFHQLLKDYRGKGRVILSQSPFIETPFLEKLLKGLKGAQSWEILSGNRYSLMKEASLSLSIPGTTTLELAYLQCPTLVLLPLNSPQDIPLKGLPGLIGALPLLGRPLKRWLVPAIAHRMEYVALPNILAREEILPEMKGILTPRGVLSRMEDLLSGKEKVSWDRIGEVLGQKGASRHMIQIIAETLG